MLKYLTDTRHYKINETSSGINSVNGDYLPIQIIKSKKLSERENLWLNSLKYNLEIKNADAILEESNERKEKVLSSAYLNILLATNPDIYKELHNMAVKTKRKTFEEVFTEAGIIPEWMDRGFKKGIVHGREEANIQIAKNLLTKGSTPEFVQEITGLSPDVIKKLESH